MDFLRMYLQLENDSDSENRCDKCKSKPYCNDTYMQTHPKDICAGFIPDFNKL